MRVQTGPTCAACLNTHPDKRSPDQNEAYRRQPAAGLRLAFGFRLRLWLALGLALAAVRAGAGAGIGGSAAAVLVVCGVEAAALVDHCGWEQHPAQRAAAFLA